MSVYHEYGYMEEGKLGKPYNLRLLNRLAHYALPYRKIILKGLFLTVLITLCDLTFPYLSKIAIDRYILSGWYRIDLGHLTNLEIKDLSSRYGNLLEKAKDGKSGYISHLNLKKIDPTDLHTYRARHIISSERFYRTEPDAQTREAIGHMGKPFPVMDDGSVLVSYDALKSLPKEGILKIRSSDLQGVTLVGLIFLFFLLFSFALSCAQYYLLELAGQNMMQDIRLRLFKRIQSHALTFFNRHPLGRLVTRVTNDIENLNEMFKSVIVTIFKDFFILTGIIVVLLYLNWRLATVSFAFLPLIFVLTSLFSSTARDAFRELRVTVARINAFLQERITGMRVIQLFAREGLQRDIFAQINHENYLAGMKQIRVFAIFMPVMELFSSLAVALLIWYGGGRVIDERLTLGSLVAFIGYIQMFFKPIRDISEKYNIMQSAMASTERIFQFMDQREEIPEPAHPLMPPKIRGHLVFNQVSFSYEKGHPVLRDISFEVEPGETVAIVGVTGSGKTTLMNLVERFHDPNEGVIYLDGVDLRDWTKAELRKNVSLCMQDVFIFSGNVADNISLGRKDIDAGDIEQAARMANALPFIQRLEHGFQQEIAEGGSTLSVGERQLLSFARALATRPTVLILDEATSSVDPETERLIQEAISRMTLKKTTLIVAHRPSTIQSTNRILVMHNGRIVEQGTHKALMALRGTYYKLNMLRNDTLSP